MKFKKPAHTWLSEATTHHGAPPQNIIVVYIYSIVRLPASWWLTSNPLTTSNFNHTCPYPSTFWRRYWAALESLIASLVFPPSDSATIKSKFITSLLHLFLQKVYPLCVHIFVICNPHLVACQHQLASASLLHDLNNSYCLLSRDAGPGGAARSVWPEFPEREPDVAHHLSSQRVKGTKLCKSFVDYLRILDISWRVTATPCRISVIYSPVITDQ